MTIDTKSKTPSAEALTSLVKDFQQNGVKKTKTPRQYDSILKGALALELKDRVELKKELMVSIQQEVNAAKNRAEEAAKIAQE